MTEELRADVSAALKRERRRARVIAVVAAVALILGGVAFALSLLHNWRATEVATHRANVAIVAAERAAAHAEAAAKHAEEAHAVADRARADLCKFLGLVRVAVKVDERRVASKLFIEFECVRLR